MAPAGKRTGLRMGRQLHSERWVDSAQYSSISPLPLQQNRDYYLWCNASATTGCTSFNGTVGVGSGTLASRPSTCTAGVAYWATDQGSWNQSGSGGQGELFKCTSTSTWTSGYLSIFPNPLTSTGGSITGVSVSCSPTSITTAQTSTCTPTVTGTGSFSSAVTWTATNGTVNSGGLYTPNPSGAPFTGVVTATSVQNSSFSGSANVSVTAPPPSLTTIQGATVAAHVQ